MSMFESLVTEITGHYVLLVCMLFYLITIFSVLKAFQYNKERFQE